MNKPILSCPHCARQYKRKTFYDKHVTLCKILSTKSEDDTTDISIKDLYHLVSNMALKQEKLERELSHLRKWIDTKKKKLSIIDWLNENTKASISYTQWRDTIQIKSSHMEDIFSNDYIVGMSNIITSHLPIDREETLCLKAFDQKENGLFIYNNEEWALLSNETFENLLMKIDKLVMTEFVLWQDVMKKKCPHNYFEMFTDNVKKVMGGNFTRDQIMCRVKRNIYKHLKINLRNIVQFEFG